MRTLVRTVALFALIGAAAYVFRVPAHTIVAQLQNRFAPCSAPIAYSIGSIDPRFGVSTSTVLNAIREAASVWESPSHPHLFSYDTKTPQLTIDLIYDSRQQTTQKLEHLGLAVEDTRASYDALKSKYDSLYAEYSRKKAEFESSFAAFQTDQSAYNRDVSYWNARGGAPQDEYDRLQREKTALSDEKAKGVQLQNAVNASASNVNAVATALNQTAGVLNLNVARYNTVGNSTGDEFEEGVYESVPGSERISIYEFGSRDQLIRVLAHELGHALGLGHVEDPDAIMYRVNQSTNGRATAADLAELNALCFPAEASAKEGGLK